MIGARDATGSAAAAGGCPRLRPAIAAAPTAHTAARTHPPNRTGRGLLMTTTSGRSAQQFVGSRFPGGVPYPELTLM